jgi:hypothetical protein
VEKLFHFDTSSVFGGVGSPLLSILPTVLMARLHRAIKSRLDSPAQIASLISVMAITAGLGIAAPRQGDQGGQREACGDNPEHPACSLSFAVDESLVVIHQGRPTLLHLAAPRDVAVKVGGLLQGGFDFWFYGLHLLSFAQCD